MTPSFAVFDPSAVAAPSRSVGLSLDRLAFAFLWAFVFILPWEDSEMRVPIVVLSGLAALGFALLRTWILGKGRKLSELHYWMLAFAAWSAVSILWTMDPARTATRAGTYLQLLVLAWLIWVLAATESRVLALMQAYVFGTYVSAVKVIVNLLTGHTYAPVDYLEAPPPGSARYSMHGANPNDLGLLLALSIPMTLYLLGRSKTTITTALLYWLQLVLCVTTIFLTGSRGAMVAATAALLMFPWTLGRLPKWQRGFALAACAGAIACAVSVVPPVTWQRLFSLGSEVTAGTMTHRTQIWEASLQVFRDHPFVGVGSGAHQVAVVGILTRPLVAHNTFLSVLTELGVVGGLVLLGLLGTAVYFAFAMRSLDQRVLWILLLVTWAIGVSGATWEYHKATWLLLGLLAAHAYSREGATP